ncbi:MAG: tannase/feruloyl esterase family alpha/beta hydrolase, partial [Bryobacteraceae bacterium]|nr:tannase/feruloyl esterase family alpha/beta hydrolase [Bryobacteraceae bacterium]
MPRTAGWMILLSAALLAAGAAKRNGRSGRPAQAAPAALAPRIECARLADSGLPGVTDVPDFQEIPGAPARITGARMVAASGTAPEFCEVTGYVQPQIRFMLRMPARTWNGRYLQHGCAGLCGSLRPPALPALSGALGGDFAVAATNDGHEGAT